MSVHMFIYTNVFITAIYRYVVAHMKIHFICERPRRVSHSPTVLKIEVGWQRTEMACPLKTAKATYNFYDVSSPFENPWGRLETITNVLEVIG